MPIIIALIFAATVSLSAFPSQAKTLNVAVSLKPLYAIVASVMTGAGKPELLIDGSLRKDAADVVSKADIVIWLGDPIEGALKEIVAEKGKEKALPLLLNDRIYTLEHRDGSEKTDPHMWMDPRNMTEMARLVGHVLADIDPENAQLYKNNAKGVMTATERMRKKLEFGLYSLRARPFYAIYDGYQYLERGHGLHFVGKPEEAVCIVGDPGTPENDLMALAKKYGAKTTRLDVFAQALNAEPMSYLKMMDNTLESLKPCLSR